MADDNTENQNNLEIKGYIVADEDKEIYEYFGYPATSPGDVRNAIAQANGAPLNVEISTCYGGSIFSGSEMYAALKGYKGGVNIAITGLAASAASVIAMAGPNEMSPTAMLMVHKVSSIAIGNHHVMDTESASLQQADKAMAAAYTTKSGMSEDDAIAMMDAETWITAKQAVEKGLVDKVMFSDSDPQSLVNAAAMPLPRAVIEKTRKMLMKQKMSGQKQPEKPEKSEESEPENKTRINLAYAKLNLIEKTMN